MSSGTDCAVIGININIHIISVQNGFCLKKYINKLLVFIIIFLSEQISK